MTNAKKPTLSPVHTQYETELLNMSSSYYRLNNAVETALKNAVETESKTGEHDDAEVNRIINNFHQADAKLDQLIAEMLEKKHDASLRKVVAGLYDKDKIEQADMLRDKIVDNTSVAYVNECNGITYSHQLWVIPVVVNVHETPETLTKDMADCVERQARKFLQMFPYYDEQCQVVVNPALLSHQDVFSLTYSEAKKRNICPTCTTLAPYADEAAYFRTVSPEDETITIGLRFLAFWEIAPVESTKLVCEDIDTIEVSQDAAVQSVELLSKELSSLMGSFMFIDAPGNVFNVRESATALLQTVGANSSLESQLSMQGRENEPMTVYISVHGDLKTRLINKVHCALIDDEGALAAGHVFDVNEYFDDEAGSTMVESIAENYGGRTVHFCEEMEPSAPAGEAPKFLTPHGWTTLLEANAGHSGGSVMLH